MMNGPSQSPSPIGNASLGLGIASAALVFGIGLCALTGAGQRWLQLAGTPLFVCGGASAFLGLLAAGTAWGEWGASDFADPAVRQEIETASGQAPPSQAPAGLDRLSSFWIAPIPDYAPPFMQSETFGYILSAVFGTGLITLAFFAISWIASLLRGGRKPDPTSQPGARTV